MVQCIANRGKKMTGQDRIGSSVRFLGFPGDSLVKNPPANARDVGSILGSGRSPRGGYGNPLWYPCLENPQEQRSLAVAKSQTRLSG